MIGSKCMEIPGVAIKKFKEWSQFPEKQSNAYDKRIADALLHILTKRPKSGENSESIEWDYTISFIRRMYYNYFQDISLLLRCMHLHNFQFSRYSLRPY